MNKGIWYGIGAYFCWGLFPIYWHWLHHVPALQLLSHRIVWSFIILFIVILFLKQWMDFRKTSITRNTLKIYFVAAILIGVNWMVYVWAVNAGFVIESSLGYFINPLLSVLFGVIFLHEHLRPMQWVPIGLAAIGVVYLSFVYGSPPWIALTLATTFATYGFVKKKAPLGSLYGLTLETGILFVPALIFLIYSEMTGVGAFLHAGTVSDSLLVGAGVVTTIPLLMFASAAQRIPLTLVGILQYISPTLQFLIGALLFREPFTHDLFIGYLIVWLALILFGVEGILARRMQTVLAAAD